MEKITRRERDIAPLFSSLECRDFELQEAILLAKENFDAVLSFWKKKRETFVQRSVDRQFG